MDKHNKKRTLSVQSEARIPYLTTSIFIFLIILFPFFIFDRPARFNPEVDNHYSKLIAIVDYAKGQSKIKKSAFILPKGDLIAKFEQLESVVSYGADFDSEGRDGLTLPANAPLNVKRLPDGSYETLSVYEVPTPEVLKENRYVTKIIVTKPTQLPILRQEFVLNIAKDSTKTGWPEIKILKTSYLDPAAQTVSYLQDSEIEVSSERYLDTVTYRINSDSILVPGQQIGFELIWPAQAN